MAKKKEITSLSMQRYTLIKILSFYAIKRGAYCSLHTFVLHMIQLQDLTLSNDLKYSNPSIVCYIHSLVSQIRVLTRKFCYLFNSSGLSNLDEHKSYNIMIFKFFKVFF